MQLLGSHHHTMIKQIIFITCALVFSAQADPECPKNWSDASHVEMGCLLFDGTGIMESWESAQDHCAKSVNRTGTDAAHLVEIFKQDQQDFIAMRLQEYEFATGTKRVWWIGATDELLETRWVWPFTFKIAEFSAWADGYPKNDLSANYAAMGGDKFLWQDYSNSRDHFPICQYVPTEE